MDKHRELIKLIIFDGQCLLGRLMTFLRLICRRSIVFAISFHSTSFLRLCMLMFGFGLSHVSLKVLLQCGCDTVSLLI